MLNLIHIVKSIQGFCKKIGLIVKAILIENQFDPMRGALTIEKVKINIVCTG